MLLRLWASGRITCAGCLPSTRKRGTRTATSHSGRHNLDRTRGVISVGMRRDMRKAFMDIIYENERARLYLEKNTIRDLLRDQAVQELGGLGLRRFLREINLEAEAEAGGRPGLVPALDDEVRVELQARLEEIARAMPGHGRIALKYMPPEVKEIVQNPPTGCSGSRALRTRPDATRRSPRNWPGRTPTKRSPLTGPGETPTTTFVTGRHRFC